MTFQTKKQLREALQQAAADRNAAEDRAAKLGRDLDHAVDVLERLGASRTTNEYASIYGAYSITDWDTSKVRADYLYTQRDFDERHEATATQSRRETLEKVIEALEIKGYANGGYIHPYDSSKNKTTYAADKFWDDINTTLEHREAEKHAETVRKTAERVAGLTKKAEPARFFVFNHDESYGSAQTISEGDYAEPRPTPKKKPAKPAKEGEKK